MSRLTPQQIIDREMEKLKAMGVTMNVKLAPGGENPRVMSVLKDAAKEHGIHYGEEDDEDENWERHGSEAQAEEEQGLRG